MQLENRPLLNPHTAKRLYDLFETDSNALENIKERTREGAQLFEHDNLVSSKIGEAKGGDVRKMQEIGLSIKEIAKTGLYLFAPRINEYDQTLTETDDILILYPPKKRADIINMMNNKETEGSDVLHLSYDASNARLAYRLSEEDIDQDFYISAARDGALYLDLDLLERALDQYKESPRKR